MLPGEATLRVGRKRFELFLMPGGKLEVTINLPEIFWSESHLFGKKENGQLIWFEGTYAALNTELVKHAGLMNIYNKKYEPELLRELGISESSLPEIIPYDRIYPLAKEPASVLGLKEGTPVIPVSYTHLTLPTIA